MGNLAYLISMLNVRHNMDTDSAGVNFSRGYNNKWIFFMIHICSPLLQLYGTDFFIFFKQVFLLNMSLKKSCSKSAEFIQVACISA